MAYCINQVRSNERVDETTAHWYWRGDSLSGDDTTPIFPMSAEISAHLDAAYLMFLSNGLPFGSYNVNGVPYQVDFTLMLQVNNAE